MWFSPRKQITPRFRQSAHDQVIRVIDHFAQFCFRDSTADLDSVPMFFIHVIAGLDLLVLVA
jgi:hypothetical protein